MRTDSTSISEEANKAIKDEIIKKYGIEYYEHRDYKNKKANTQEAHECIRPTKINYETIEGTTEEMRLYSMIWKRTIQSQMKSAEYQTIVIEIDLLNRTILTPYKLVGSLENMIYVGFLIVDGKKATSPLNIESIKKLLIKWDIINACEDTQKPPTRYNEASLINKIDPKNLNIGRPSTYASIINKIITREYVITKDIEGKNIELNKYSVSCDKPKNITQETKNIKIGSEKKKLIPTELGRNATEFLEKYFAILMDYNFTATMEKNLDEIAEGEKNKNEIIKPFYDYIQEQINNIPKNIMANSNFSQPEIIGKYKNYDVVLNNGPYGKYITCNNYKFNLKMLFSSHNDIDTDLSENMSNEQILNKVEEKIEQLSQAINKEWKIKNKKYILKKGQYGYYVEEWNNSTNKKTNNFSIKFLIEKIGKNNNITAIAEDNIKKIINLISNKDIEETVDYFINKKK
jgi:DNA topoisomerase-1